MKHCLIDQYNGVVYILDNARYEALLADKFTHYIDLYELDEFESIKRIVSRIDEILGYGADMDSIYKSIVTHNRDSCADWAYYAFSSRYLFFRNEQDCMLAKLSL